MDFKNGLDYRTGRFHDYNYTGDVKYDFEKNGILEKCLPKILFKGNSIFVTFLQLLDMKIIMLIKYISRLKQFKYITWYI